MNDIQPKVAKRVYDVSDSPTLQHFMSDFHTPFCGVMSHVNSGKTSAMCVKSQLVAKNQHPDADGIRRSSHMFIRGTQGDLLRSTVRTFSSWVDPNLISIRKSTPIGGDLEMQPLHDQNQHFPEHYFREGKLYPYMIGGWDAKNECFMPDAIDVSGQRIGDVFPNGTFVHARFDFVPLDNPEWESILLGYEATAAYFDEPDSMSNIEEVLTKLPGRLGRMPPADMAPLTCTQVNMAFNPPPRDSFTQNFFDPNHESYGPGRKLYRVQPPFLMQRDPKEPNNFFKANFIKNPRAEGVRYAAKGFKHWQDIIDANRHDPNKIRRDVLGEWTHGSGGDLIHTEFDRDKHVVEEIKPNKSLKIFCSCDWGNCYDSETEILTKSGWKLFKDVEVGEKVATRNPKTEAFEYQATQRVVKHQHKGKMFRFFNRSCDFNVTPDHDVPLHDRYSHKFSMIKAKEISEGSDKYLDLTSQWQGEDPLEIMGYPAEQWAWFMGMFMTDGNLKQGSLFISQIKQKGRKQLESKLDYWKWNQRSSFANGYYFSKEHHPELCEFVHSLGKLKKDRRIPQKVLDLSPRLLSYFVHGMITGDGDIRKRGRSREYRLYTAHQHIADQLMEVAQKMGMWLSVNVHKGQTSYFPDGRQVISKDGLRLTFRQSKKVTVSDLKREVTEYDDMVYCVTVPNHVVYVRKNGRPHWNGNSGAMLIAQVESGGVRVIEEMSAKDTMAHEFVQHEVIPHLNSTYRGYDIIVTGDPSGRYKRDVGEGPFKIFEDAGFLVEDDTAMDPEERWSAVNHALKYQDGLKIAKGCDLLIKGFEGEYTFKRQSNGTTLRQADKRKHHSAYQDCLQAICCLVFEGYESAATSVQGMSRYDRDEDTEEDDFPWV